ncbi:MAG: DnaJ domain-containing protein [Deltaproteobacteria bacterium]|nr:DnaJ domain-containing protein [Deltaproteobacteria bacterium]
MTTQANFYTILNLKKNATAQEIKEAYRELALQFHPDQNAHPEAEEQFKRINEAYRVLANADSRTHYDRFGAAPRKAGGASAPFNAWPSASRGPGQGCGRSFGRGCGCGPWSRIFKKRTQHPQTTNDGPDHICRVSLSASELQRGTSRTLHIQDGREALHIRVEIPPGSTPGKRIIAATSSRDTSRIILELESLP